MNRMNGIILNILNTCLELRTCGVDAFFNYDPNVGWIDVDVHVETWKGNQIPDYKFHYVKVGDLEGLKEVEDKLAKILAEVKNDR